MKRSFYRLLFALFLLPVCQAASAQAPQLQLQLNLMPPYSPYFSDYLTYNNKALLTVTKLPGATISTIYFRGRITGDNGVSGVTKPGYKPAFGTTLPGPVTILKSPDFESYFSLSNFDISGVNMSRIVRGNGLPEGAYTICLQAFDFATNAPVSDEAAGCFTIQIRHVEPPVPRLPICDSKVEPNATQTIMLTWDPAMVAPPGTKYVVKMAELQPNQNPNDALNTLTTPPFLEAESIGGTTSFTINNISTQPLTKGRKYAWRVTAYDPKKETVFRNDGMSPVCVFQYGDADTGAIQQPDPNKLTIYNPQCKPDAAGINRWIVGPGNDAYINFFWSSQEAEMEATKKEAAPVAQYAGQPITQYLVTISALQKEGTAKTAVKGNGSDPSPLYALKADSQALLLSYSKLINAANGLRYDHWYKVRVVAMGPGYKTLYTTESCDLLLTAPAAQQQNSVIKGTLSYRLEKGGKVYPTANGTSITVHLVQGKNGKATDAKAIKAGDAVVRNNGTFSASFQNLPADNSYTHVRLTINNPYYAPLDTAIRADLFFLDTVTKKPSKTIRPEVSIGQVVADAYAYDLTLTVTKGFQEFVYDSLTGKVKVNPAEKDKLTIREDIPLKTGIRVLVFRKSKPGVVPPFEGDETKPGKPALWSASWTTVAEGFTANGPVVNGKPTTVVTFRNLLCNMLPDDRYFVQAILPINAKVPCNNPTLVPIDSVDECLTAPVSELRYNPDIDGPKTKVSPHFAVDRKYNVISKLPPMSTIRGSLAYKWDSKPGVIRPLSNVPFEVTVDYTFDGKPEVPTVSGCEDQKPAGWQAQVTNPDGTVTMIDSKYSGRVVGTGTTDASGAFRINVLNYDRDAFIQTGMKAKLNVMLANCDPKSINVPELESPYVGMPWKEVIDSKINPGYEYGMNDIFGSGAMTGGHNVMLITNEGLSTNPGGFSSQWNANALLNGGNLAVSGVTNTKDASKGVTGGFKAGQKGSGPAAGDYDDGNGYTGNGFDFKPIKSGKEVTLDRVFTVHLADGRKIYYKSFPDFKASPFSDTSVGTLVAGVREERNGLITLIPVRKNGAVTETVKGFDLTGGRLIIARAPGDAPANAPDGEGAAKHEMKPLMRQSMMDNAVDDAAQPVEWILDTPLPIENGNRFSIKDKSLLQSTLGHYLLQAAPLPNADAAANFDPATATVLTKELKVLLRPAKMGGRVEDAVTHKGIPGAKVTLWGSIFNFAVVLTDDEGYWEYRKGDKGLNGTELKWEDNDGTNVKAKVSLSGYAAYASDSRPAPKFGQQLYFATLLQPDATIWGSVRNEDGTPVDGYVFSEDTSNLADIYPGKDNGIYFLGLTSGVKHDITFKPLDPAYFDTTITLPNVQKGLTKLPEITFQKRQHRMRFVFTVKNAAGGIKSGPIPVNTFRVTINNSSDAKYSKMNGANNAVEFAFENVSVNNYTIQVEDISGSGYIPLTFNVKNDESRKPVVYNVVMQEGITITGVVRTSGVPLPAARVYVDHESAKTTNGSDTSSYNNMTAYTNNLGVYTIKGIPGNLKKLKVRAVYQTKSNYQDAADGDDTTVTVSKLPASIDFNIRIYNGIALYNLWGFPLTVEKLDSVDKNKWRVSGLLDLSQNNSSFGWLDNNTKVRVTNVDLISTTGQSGKKVLTPEGLTMQTGTKLLKMKFANKYNVALASETQSTFGGGPFGAIYTVDDPLTLTKTGPDVATIFSKAHIVDNSYNYPSTYLNFKNTGDFYLARKDGNKVTTKVPSITSDSKAPKSRLLLSDKEGDPLAFQFIGFDATAKPDSSYIDPQDSRIHLNIRFNGPIPNSDMGSVAVHLPDVVLDEGEIKSTKGIAPLFVQLQDWALEVRDWVVDPKLGGLYSTNAIIKTGVVDINASRFNLRHDLFVLEKFDTKNITLGGGTLALENVSDNSTFLWDPATGSDKKGHWRFAIAPKSPGGYAATFNVENQQLGLDYLQLISYGKGNESIVSMKAPEKGIIIAGNDKLRFRPTSLSSNVGYFTLIGNTSFEVPRLPTVPIEVKYENKSGKLTPEIKPFQLKFDGKGYTRFLHKESDAVVHKDGISSLSGTVEEPGKFAPIPCKLIFGTGNDGRLELQDGYEINMTPGNGGAKTTTLTLAGKGTAGDGLQNGALVTNKDWSILRFEGLLKDVSANKNRAPVNMKFEVLGAIEATTSGIKAEQIPTPFGNVNMVYEFPSTLHGAMDMKDVAMGSWKFNGGVEVVFSPEGWNVLGVGELNTGTLLVDGFGTLNIGLTLGNYKLTDGMIKKVVQFSKDPTKKCWLEDANKNGFSGFYCTGGYDVINVHEGFDAILASGYFNAVVGVEASLGANMGKNYNLGLGAHGIVSAGLGSITGTSIKGGMEAHATASATIGTIEPGQPAGFAVNGQASLKAGFEICQSLLVTDVCVGFEKEARIDMGYTSSPKASYFKFNFGSAVAPSCVNSSSK